MVSYKGVGVGDGVTVLGIGVCRVTMICVGVWVGLTGSGAKVGTGGDFEQEVNTNNNPISRATIIFGGLGL